MNILTRIVLLLSLLLAFSGCAEKVTADLNVPYGEANGQTLLVDVFQPSAKSAKPRVAVVLFHGGAWVAGNKSETHDMARGLARNGYVAFSVGYRLATPAGNHWPAQLDDAQRAVRWVRAHAGTYGIDPRRVGAMGGSAGGHLVACLGTNDTRDNSDPALAAWSSRVTCIIDMCGPVDLTSDHTSPAAWANEQVVTLFGGKPSALPALARSASPLFQVSAASAPALIVHGRKDDLVPLDQSERFAAALKQSGVDARLFVHDGGHGMDDSKAVRRLMTEATDFLRTYLEP